MSLHSIDIILIVAGALAGVGGGYAWGAAAGRTKGREEVIAKVRALIVRGKLDFDLEDALRKKT